MITSEPPQEIAAVGEEVGRPPVAVERAGVAEGARLLRAGDRPPLTGEPSPVGEPSLARPCRSLDRTDRLRTLRAKDETSSELDVLLTEYEMLKAEQRSRIIARDRLIYATLTALAATVVAYGGVTNAPLLLLLPLVCLVLGWTYLVNDEAITAIGDYLLTELGPHLVRILGGTAVLLWERSHRNRRGQRLRKSLQLAVDLGMFILPATLSLAGFWITGPRTMVLMTAFVAELAAITVLAVRIACSVKLAPKRSLCNQASG